MIRYTLQCENAHQFDGWFKSSAAFDEQVAAELVSCPDCSTTQVQKGLMTPGVPKKASAKETLGPREFFNQVRAFRSKVLAETDDVGTAFPAQARQMHDGEIEHRPIRGNARPEEVKELTEDGIPILPIPPEPPAEN